MHFTVDLVQVRLILGELEVLGVVPLPVGEDGVQGVADCQTNVKRAIGRQMAGKDVPTCTARS